MEMIPVKHSLPAYYYDKYHELLAEGHIAGDDIWVEAMLAEFMLDFAAANSEYNTPEIINTIGMNALYRRFVGLTMLFNRNWNELAAILREKYHADILPEDAFYDRVMETIRNTPDPKEVTV